jgi:hypothetical protein
MSDFKDISLKNHGVSMSDNLLTLYVDIEEVINKFTPDEIIDNVYNLEEFYKILKKEFEA